jgi:hypothetical protein
VTGEGWLNGNGKFEPHVQDCAKTVLSFHRGRGWGILSGYSIEDCIVKSVLLRLVGFCREGLLSRSLQGLSESQSLIDSYNTSKVKVPECG